MFIFVAVLLNNFVCVKSMVCRSYAFNCRKIRTGQKLWRTMNATRRTFNISIDRYNAYLQPLSLNNRDFAMNAASAPSTDNNISNEFQKRNRSFTNKQTSCEHYIYHNVFALSNTTQRNITWTKAPNTNTAKKRMPLVCAMAIISHFKFDIFIATWKYSQALNFVIFLRIFSSKWPKLSHFKTDIHSWYPFWHHQTHTWSDCCSDKLLWNWIWFKILYSYLRIFWLRSNTFSPINYKVIIWKRK